MEETNIVLAHLVTRTGELMAENQELRQRLREMMDVHELATQQLFRNHEKEVARLQRQIQTLIAREEFLSQERNYRPRPHRLQ